MGDPTDDDPTTADVAPSGGLRSVTRSGGRWGLFSSTVQQLASIAATVVLARALSPTDFGLAAIAQSVVFFLYSFTEAGFGASLVVRRDVDSRIISSTFWAACIVGGGAALIGVAVSAPAAAALGSPRAAPFMAVASAMLLTGMAQSVVRGMLARDLRFRSIAFADMIGVGVYVTVQIVLALTTDLGTWVVVIGWVTMSAVTLVALMAFARWTPSLAFDRAELRSDLGFNARYLGVSVGSYSVKNIDNWSVSRWLGATALGGYYVAYVLPNILRQRITWVGGQVMLPVLRRLDSAEAVGEAYRKVAQIVGFVAFPALFGLAVAAAPIVRLFFGSQWEAAVGPMRILSSAAAIDAIGAIAVPVMFSLSKPAGVMRATIARLATLAVGIGVAVATGPSVTRIAIAVLASTIVGTIVTFAVLHEVTALGPLALGRSLLPPTFAAALMAAAVTAVLRSLRTEVPATQLTAAIGVGAAVYFASGFACFASDFRESARECLRFATGR